MLFLQFIFCLKYFQLFKSIYVLNLYYKNVGELLCYTTITYTQSYVRSAAVIVDYISPYTPYNVRYHVTFP
jgi:hypothetical protein